MCVCALDGAGCVLGTRRDHSPVLWSMSLAWWMPEGSRPSCMLPGWQVSAPQPLVRRKRREIILGLSLEQTLLFMAGVFSKRLFMFPQSLLLASVVRCE